MPVHCLTANVNESRKEQHTLKGNDVYVYVLRTRIDLQVLASELLALYLILN